jgi:Protein of unknown function (DUF3667)
MVMQKPTVCLNCHSPIQAQQAYCPDCGQATDMRRLDNRAIVDSLWQNFTGLDRGFLPLLRELLLRPGLTARAYLNGSRIRYMGPFAFLLLMVGIHTLIVQASDFIIIKTNYDSSIVAQLIQKHFNLAILLQVPLLSMILNILFRKTKLNLAEHAVLASYILGFRSLFSVVFTIPLQIIMMKNNLGEIAEALSLAMGSIWIIFTGYSATQFYSEHSSAWWRFCKGAIASLLSQGALVMLVSTMVVLWMQLY